MWQSSNVADVHKKARAFLKTISLFYVNLLRRPDGDPA